MAGFSSGLLAGFQFIEGINDMRERRRLSEEQLGLQRAANSRAEAAFQTQQDVIADSRLRQQRTDEAGSVFARAQRVGYDNLEPHEMAQLDDAAPYNPNIGAWLEEGGQRKRDVQAIADLGNLSQQPRGLAAAAQPQAQSPSPQPVDPNTLSPFDAVTQGADAQLPEAQPQGLRTVHNTYLRGLVPGYTPDPSMVNPKNGTVDLPPEMIAELEEAKDKPVVERQAIVDKYRAQLGDPAAFSASMQARRQAAAAAKSDIESYRSFLDPEDESGADLRRMAKEDPVAFVSEFANDYTTIQRDDPNTLAILNREMQPVVDQALKVTGTKMRSLPVGTNGRITNDASTRSTMTEFNRVMTLQQNMSDEFKPELQAAIRRGVMPIGNAELAGGVRGIVEGTASPSSPETGSQLRANMTIARRAVEGVEAGGRNLSTKQVEALAWLTKRGYISPDGFEQFLTTGTFQKPRERNLMSHDPDKMLFDEQTGAIIYTPTAKARPEDISGWADDQQKVISDFFAPPPGATAEQVEQAKRMENGFYIASMQNARELWGADFNVNDYRQMSRSDIALLTTRYKALQETRSAWDDSYWYGKGVMGWWNGDAEDQGLNITNFDKLARELNVVDNDQQLPLPVPKPQTDAARMALAGSDDITDRIMATIANDREIGQAIISARENQNPPPPAVTEK